MQIKIFLIFKNPEISKRKMYKYNRVFSDRFLIQ